MFSETGKVRARSLEKIPSFVCTSGNPETDPPFYKKAICPGERPLCGIPKMGPIVGRLPGRRAFSCIFLTQNNLLILIFLHLLSLSFVLSVHRAMADDGLTSVAKLMQARKRVLGSVVQPKLYF